MRKILILLSVALALQGCSFRDYTKQKVVTEVKKWEQIYAIKDDGLQIKRDLKAEKFYKKLPNQEKWTVITEQEFVFYLTGIFLGEI